MPAVTNEQIEALALASGFKPKPQPDGSMALHPHVFEFARQLLAAGQSLPVVEWLPIETAPRAPLAGKRICWGESPRGPEVLVFYPPSNMRVARHTWFPGHSLHPDGVWEISSNSVEKTLCRPTHWAAITPPTVSPSATPTAE